MGLMSASRTVAETGPGAGVFTETLLELLGPDGEIFVIEPTRIMCALRARPGVEFSPPPAPPAPVRGGRE